MGAMKPMKRKNSARFVAERLGISERTVRRYIAQPRAEYLAEGYARQDEALRLRESGLKWREVGEQLGGISEPAAYRLATKAKERREQQVTA